MKIIAWNCNMAFRTKVHAIAGYQPDIVIVPECECPEKLVFDEHLPKPAQILWFGSNKSKGMGIFSYGRFRMKELDCHNARLRMIIPIEVTDGATTFNLFAVWANNPMDKKNQYVGQIWKALKQYNKLLSAPSILAGDFNSNTIWDRPKRIGNHSHVVEKLEKKGIYSCYHKHFNCEQGKEGHNTLFMYRHNDKGYHIDYCFASEHFLERLQQIEIGEWDYWKKFSDHMPVIVTFGERREKMTVDS